MSKIQVSRTVKFISKAGTYTAVLQSNRGQLWQSYQGDAATPNNIVPNWEGAGNGPLLNFVVVSSRTSGSAGITSTPKWYFGNVLLNPSSVPGSDSAGTVINASVVVGGTAYNLADYFELVSPSTGQLYYGLRIKKNIVVIAQGTAVTIKAVGIIAGANFTDDIQASHTINIYPQTGSAAQIDILDITTVGGVANVGRNFTFDADNQIITMKVESYIGSMRVDETAAQISSNGITYLWQRIENGAWVNVKDTNNQDVTTQTLNVTEQEVQTYAKYRCAVYKNSVLLGYGKANIMDSTDPYIIEPNPIPKDETIEDVGDTVVYTPKIVTRGTGAEVSEFSNMKYNFIFTASDGVVVGSATNQASGTVTYDMCLSNGNIDVTIESYSDVNDY